MNEQNTAESFFKDQLQYPFPVRYEHLPDAAGRNWEIAFMDVCPAGCDETRKALPVVVLLHGRGVNASYFGELITGLVERGFRVIAPDIPHYGKSNPGNLDLPLTRSLQDVRFLFRQLLARLGIGKAAFVGHSLGGQIALGYALDYPEQVSHLVLMASPGLREFEASPLYRRELADDLEAWQSEWKMAEVIEREMSRSEDEIRQVHYGQSGLWFFSHHGTIQEEISQQRIRLASAPEKELRNHVTMVLREMYSLGMENQKGDPDSITSRIPELKMPILVAMGEIDPFISPKTIADPLLWPFQERLKAAGNPPLIKVYPNTGHFIHVEAFDLFFADLLSFLTN